MSTPTFTEPTPSTPEAPSHIPVALWKAYRWQRGRNERPRIAASIALDQLHYTSQRSREPLTAMLTERERERGLGSTESEQDEELALESAELEAGGAVEPEPEPGSAEAVRRGAQRTIAELESKRAGLAPEALTDLDARAQVENIDREIREARLSAELADLAETETARRAREQAEQAAQAGREEADRQAQAMVPKVAALKAAVDSAAGAWVTAVVELRDAQEQHAAFVSGATGGDAMATRSVRFRDGDVAGALRASLHGRIRLDGLGTGSFRETLLVPLSESGE
jgi:hypothetical protein